MNLLDLIVILVMAVGGLVGTRTGFVVRALSWLGLAIGLTLALRITPRLARALAGASPGTRLLAVASLLIGLALIGHTFGLLASRTLREKLSLTSEPTPLDRVTGGVLGALGALALLWLLLPALRSTPGVTARATRGSALVALVDQYAPRQPRAARVLGRLMGDAPFPLFKDTVSVGRAPNGDAGPTADARTSRSVVLVTGNACNLHLSGTGFAIAPDLVVTNAHVVAGESHTNVVTSDRRELAARVVVFDGRHDVAVLAADGAHLPPLSFGPVRLGTVASVLGHPNGGQLRATPARVARRIDAPRSDITRSGTITTSIVGLAARLIVGDSGAPVVGGDGRVQAMVFAVDPASATTAFALSSHEIRPFAAKARPTGKTVSTGECLN